MLNDYLYYEHDGELSKGKIHCSCGICTEKTRNKGNRRKLSRNYWPSLNFKTSDLRKIESMNEQLIDFY